MKIVFFRQLLLDDATKQWTASQQIVYSHLLSQSILRLDGVFSASNTSVDFASIITDYCDSDGFIELTKVNIQELALILNLSRQNIYDSIEALKSMQYIDGDTIYCPSDILYHGYFELLTESGLTKHLLIFYSWLKERAKPYNNTIDTYSYRLAELFGTSNCNIRKAISRLENLGFAKRLKTQGNRYGKLLIQ